MTNIERKQLSEVGHILANLLEKGWYVCIESPTRQGFSRKLEENKLWWVSIKDDMIHDGVDSGCIKRPTLTQALEDAMCVCGIDWEKNAKPS